MMSRTPPDGDVTVSPLVGPIVIEPACKQA